MKDKKTSALESENGHCKLFDHNNYPPHQFPELLGSQSLRITKAAVEAGFQSVMTEQITSMGETMKTLMDDPDRLLKAVMTDQILAYTGISGGLTMGILCSKSLDHLPEDLIPLKLKVDNHLLKIGVLNKKLTSPEGQISITGAKQVNIGVGTQQIANMETQGKAVEPKGMSEEDEHDDLLRKPKGKDNASDLSTPDLFSLCC